MKYKFLFSLLVLLLVSYQGHAESANNTSRNLQEVTFGTPLRILSFNFNAETRNERLKHQRLPLIEKYIKEQNPDVIAIQESWNIEDEANVARIIAKDLDLDIVYHIQNGSTLIHLQASTVVLAKKEMHLRDTVMLKLPHSAPITWGDGQSSWNSVGGTSFLIGGHITLKDGSDGFFWTTHLTPNSNGDNNKLDIMRVIFEQMKQSAADAGIAWENTTACLTGDMNSTPESPQMQYAKNVMGMKNLWDLAHPGDPGVTSIGDYDHPEYYPTEHGANQIPSQYAAEGAERIDHILCHSPKRFNAGETRVFTSPTNNIWMSDHFGLLANVNFGDDSPIESASRDSDMSLNGPTVKLKIDDNLLAHWALHKNFVVNTHRGFTVINTGPIYVDIYFSKGKDHVYTDNNASLFGEEAVSFAFDQSGKYKYHVVVRDYREDFNSIPDLSREPYIYDMDGELDVQLP